MTSNVELTCSLCSNMPGVYYTISNYLKHLRLFHVHQADFRVTCGISGCQRSYTNMGTFQNHVYNVHYCKKDTTDDFQVANHLECNDTSVVDDIHNSDEDSFTAGDNEPLTVSSPEQPGQKPLQHSSALFLLGLKEKYKLTQVAIQGVIDGVSSLNQHQMSLLKAQVFATLDQANIVPSDINGLENCFTRCENLFLGLENQYRQNKYFATNFNLIEPTGILLGERRKWKFSGTKRKCVLKKDYVYYVPILDTLEALLNNQFLLAEVEQGHRSLSCIMEDYCDGEAFSVHPLFSAHLDAFQIFFYFDELEVANAIGSKAKIHKLGTFYFTIGNLSPKYRSQLSSIYLVALVKAAFISNYGMDSVLKPIVDDIKKLEQGVEMTVCGNPRVQYGTLAVVSADNLGSLVLGGFKESCSAIKMCRHCMATKEDTQTKFLDQQFIQRDSSSHKTNCILVEQDKTGELSKEYGINRNSILNQLSYFNVCDGSLVPDVMHDCLEGVVQYEVKLLLRVLVQNNYFTLEDFNSRLENIELGYMESKNRPTMISARIFSSNGNSLKQNASQMWLLGQILPLLMGDLVYDDDEHWLLFLQLMEIVDLLFCPKTSKDHAAYVATLINEHHSEFRKLYPNNTVIPKMHFLIHMPRLMIQYGPLVRHWTMRFEAKHSYFKQLAHSMGNFINLPYSLAVRHQHYQCYLNTTATGIPAGSVDNVEVGPGSVTCASTLQEKTGYLISEAFSTKWVKTNGYEYKINAGVILDVEHDLPVVGVIKEIYVISNHQVLLRVTSYCTYFEPHFRAYILEDDTDTVLEKFVYLSGLFLQVPVHIRRSQVLRSHHFILLPYALCTL